jgi:hypothetical protein
VDELPDMPPGCEITTAVDAGGVTLSWPAYKSGSARFAGAGFLAFWLCGWVAAWFLAARALVLGQGNLFLLFWLTFWTLAGVAVVRKLWGTFRSVRPEFVRLEADRLLYDPGRGPSETRSCAELPSGAVVPVAPAAATEALRSAVRGFTVDRVNDRQRLYFDLAGRRVEIGGCLTESERAWLLAVLRRWLGEAKPVPAWAHGARRDTSDAPA